MDWQRGYLALADDNAALLARLRLLENQLAPCVELPLAWRLSRSERIVFRALLARTLCPRETLFTALYADRSDPPEAKIIHIFINRLRGKLRGFGIVIETLVGEGYSLAGRESWRAALAGAGGKGNPTGTAA